MSDTYSEPQVITPDPVLPMPGDYDQGSRSDPVKAIKEKAFDAIATDQSEGAMERYVEESKDRAAEEAGETLSPQRKQARAERYQRALEAARSADSSTSGNSAQSQQTNQEGPQNQEDADHWQRQLDLARAGAQYDIRAEQFSKAVPDFREHVQSIMSIFTPPEHVAERLLQSPHGPRLAYELSMNIDALEELNALSPAKAREAIAKLEGQLDVMERNQAAPVTPARRATKAPPPLKTVRGGAAKAFDPNDCTMAEYVAWRKRSGDMG